MNFFKFFTFIVVSIEITICFCARQMDTRCELTLPTDIPENEPLYLVVKRNNLTVFKPRGQLKSFAKRKLYLYCPGKNNSIQIMEENIGNTYVEVGCEDSKFLIDGFGYVNNLKVVNCTNPFHPEIKMRKQRCSYSGHIIDVGFKLSNNPLFEIFKICFDNLSLTPLWTKHIINGKSIRYYVEEIDQRDYKATGLLLNVRPGEAYKKAVQINHFKDLIGIKQTVTYFSSTSYLVRSQLVPDEDFVFPSAQYSTYYYVNTCPLFESIYGGNWLRVESLARKLAEHYSVDMEIYTGTLETLQLENSFGELQSLYLTTDRKILVPKWIWKIIRNPSTNSAIVFITLNDPYRGEEEVEEFCTNVCVKASINLMEFKEMKKGYTFCCELSDFTRTVNLLPSEVQARNLLTCSSIVLDDLGD